VSLGRDARLKQYEQELLSQGPITEGELVQKLAEYDAKLQQEEIDAIQRLETLQTKLEQALGAATELAGAMAVLEKGEA
jgi:hypothetical protein